jgi:hypothetical protein
VAPVTVALSTFFGMAFLLHRGVDSSTQLFGFPREPAQFANSTIRALFLFRAVGHGGMLCKSPTMNARACAQPIGASLVREGELIRCTG